MVLVAHSLAVVTPDVTDDAEDAALEALDAALVALVDALLADVAALEALVAAAWAWYLALNSPPATALEVLVAQSLARAAEAAALVADVVAVAASTSSDHLAASALVPIGCEPLEVC